MIYGGSNTVLSRAALDKIGGFYTESITEDFATGILTHLWQNIAHRIARTAK